MTIDDKAIVSAASGTLSLIGAAVPGPAGIVLSILAEVIDPVYAAIVGGGDHASTVKAIKDAIVEASDRQMAQELGAKS